MALTPGSSPKRALASRLSMVRPVCAAWAAMIRSCAPRGELDRRTWASRRPWWAEIPVAVAGELARLRAENARLLKMLELSPRQAAPPGPAQAGFFDAPPGPVHKDSPNDASGGA